MKTDKTNWLSASEEKYFEYANERNVITSAHPESSAQMS